MARKVKSKTLLLASNNQSKISELKHCFHINGLTNIELLIPANFNLESPEETENTFEGNAKLKAKFYGDTTGHISLSDDTGVCIEPLGGMPGVWTADWLKDFKTYNNPMDRVEFELRKVGYTDNIANATAVCSQVIYWPEDKHFESVTIEMPGVINMAYKDYEKTYRGQDVIGFRGVFIPQGCSKPLAMLDDAELEKVNHRIIALNQLISRCIHD
jgi:XTP/dITP diphosphohydrolase